MKLKKNIFVINHKIKKSIVEKKIINKFQFNSDTKVYEMDGTVYSPAEVVQIYVDTIDEYKQENPDFFGAKLIYAPWRRVSNHTIEKYIATIVELNGKFPDFVVGFDFVGQEDLGRRLFDFVPYVLQLPANINGFFHAGETNWFGETDENLVSNRFIDRFRNVCGNEFVL